MSEKKKDIFCASIQQRFGVRSMQAEAERTLNNLHVLAALSHNDKLLTNDDSFDIHAPTTMRAAWRFWCRERRSTNVQRVRICVRSATDFVSKTLEETSVLISVPLQSSQCPGNLTDDPPDTLRLKIETIAMQHFRMLDALKLASKGLCNLLQTYRDDPALTSQVQLIVNEISDFVSVIEPHSNQLRRRCALIAEPEETIRKTLQ
jgi:hypothetical protein